MNDLVVVIAGPTASGKSNLALRLAESFDGEIINADSLQVYKGLKVLTAVPAGGDMGDVRHHLYGVLEPGVGRSTLGWWFDQARAAIEDVAGRGRLPIVVGGTGLYINGLVYGVTPMPDVDSSVREQISHEFTSIGSENFWNRLARMDEKVVGMIRPTDTQRMKRAYEVKSATGVSVIDWWKKPPVTVGRRFLVILINKERSYLFKQCDVRFIKMIEAGAVHEVIEFRKKYGDLFGTIRNAIGLTEIEQYLDGKSSLGDAINVAQVRTRQYAKRQITWFRNKLRPDHIISENDDVEIFKEAHAAVENAMYDYNISKAAL